MVFIIYFIIGNNLDGTNYICICHVEFLGEWKKSLCDLSRCLENHLASSLQSLLLCGNCASNVTSLASSPLCLRFCLLYSQLLSLNSTHLILFYIGISSIQEEMFHYIPFLIIIMISYPDQDHTKKWDEALK